jgi:hypothetical protein
MQIKVFLTGYMRDVARKEYLILENVSTIAELKNIACKHCKEFNDFPFHVIAEGKVIHNLDEKISPKGEYMLMPLFIGG